MKAAREEAERREMKDNDTEPIIIKDGITLKEAFDFVIYHEKLPFRLNSLEDDSAESDAEKILGKYIAYDLPKIGHGSAAEIRTQIQKNILYTPLDRYPFTNSHR